jgi:hypothetical protein
MPHIQSQLGIWGFSIPRCSFFAYRGVTMAEGSGVSRSLCQASVCACVCACESECV